MNNFYQGKNTSDNHAVSMSKDARIAVESPTPVRYLAC